VAKQKSSTRVCVWGDKDSSRICLPERSSGLGLTWQSSEWKASDDSEWKGIMPRAASAREPPHGGHAARA